MILLVVVNGGTVLNNVYAGANYGATAYTKTSGTYHAKVKMLAGTVNGSVYGGGNNNGTGGSGATVPTTVDILGGTVNGSVYGGSKTEGTINGATTVSVTGGNITGSVYGGGEGNETRVTGNVAVTIGDSTANEPDITGNVYGGSAFGAVNTNSNNTVTVTVENGLIRGSVFGGGRGGTHPADNQSYTPYVNGGTITVTINDGDISKVYGGHDQAGSYSANDYVILNGGIIDEVYGGGNRSSVTTTNVTLNGSEVGSLYGGSNVLGGVSTANVTITSGEVGEVYGGNNVGGNCVTTIVHVEGTAEVTGAIYGGGKSVSTTSTMVDLYSATGGRIPNVYGGGYSAGVTTAVVNQRGASVGNLFGGSNYNGTVTTATITHYSGSTTAVYGGNNAGGNTITATIDYRTGSSDNIYGGGNQANGGTADITISGGTVVNVFGGGNRAGLDESQIVVTGGTYAIDNIYGGSDNSGKVDETHVTVETLSRKILSLFGGGKSAEVGDTEVIINNGIFDALYGGGHLAQATGDTLVDINGGTINGSMYGGGNYGVVKGSSTVTITDATIYGSAYAGGRGESATLEGSTSITIDGSTTIGTSQSVPPHNGSVFGGGDQAATGKASLDNSTSVVNIVSGTIYGNVYGGANTSVIYGNTTVNIGSVAVNQQGLNVGNIYIKGHIFGGGEANASGSEIYDWDFISVTQGTHINVNGLNHNSLTINGSFYGGGNAAKANGDTFLSIKNYGTMGNPKSNISIQRVNNVQINNSSVLLHGAVDRANDYNTELFSISRVDYLNLENNSELYLETGANLLKNFRSMDNNGNYARVTINENTNTVTKYVDNRLYMYEGKNLNIATDQQVTEYGQVYGMTFLGMFNYSNESVHTGIYHSQYDAGDLLSWSDTFNKGSYVLGSHRNNHNIQTDGFYSNFINEKTAINEVKYIEPTPEDALFYMWFIGENVLEYNVNIVASKYTTLGSIEVPFIEFTKPNTSFQILSFDSSEIAEGISLVDKNSIPRIASNATDANNRFGLSIEASNAGWLTTGKTNFYTSSPYMTGVTYYEGENSTAVPTMLFYLYHSKNVSEKKDLGTVRISVMTITKLNALTNEISRLVINVNMSTELYNTNEYEGSMTPGDKYELFASTTNNLTTRSKFSAYYSLYSNNNNIYRAGYHRALTSSFIFPEGTKITMLDFINGTPEYYYHVITAADVARTEAEYQLENECSYLLSMFTRMGSRSNTENYDDAAKNLLYYDGADSNEEFIFIVDFSDTEINHDVLEQTLLIEMRDVNEESIITVLGVERDQLKYNLYSGRDSTISVNVTVTDNPLYIGYSDVFDVVVSYQNSLISSLSIIDTQYFDSKLGLQLYLINGEGNRVSGTDLTGVYFQMDNEIYYPDITGITHIKMSDKVGNSEKWIIMNTANSKLATGTYQVVFECFGSADGIYYSNERPVYHYMNLTIINSTYGLEPLLDDNSVVFMSNNDKTLKFNIRYTSHLDNPNLRLAIYRRKYEGIYDTEYELVDLLDYVDEDLDTTNNVNEYLLMEDPNATNSFDLAMKDDLLTGTYRLAFRLYDENTMIGEVVRYIIIR